ncbi:MAG: porin [Pseudomonadota bacterium]|nr:porin [Pseudomonadota bacterium]
MSVLLALAGLGVSAAYAGEVPAAAPAPAAPPLVPAAAPAPPLVPAAPQTAPAANPPVTFEPAPPSEPAAPDAASPSDAARIAALEARLAALEAEQVALPQVEPAPAQTFPGLLNPSISFNGLFLGSAQWNDGVLAEPHVGGEAGEAAFPGGGETFGTGLNVQEMELQLRSVVDPYFNASITLAIPGTEGVEAEEAYVQLTAVPRLLVNVGKFKQPFGRENATHTHALLTVDKSLVGQRIFGGEGLNDVAVNAQLLLPTPWYSELTLGVDRGTHDVLLGSGDSLGVGGMAHWKNLFDLSYETSIELGVSGLVGKNAFDGTSVVGGVDLTLKSHGRGSRQWNRLVWQSEYLVMKREGAPEDASVGGLYSTVEYALTRRLWVGGRFDYVGLPEPVEGGHSLAATGILVLAPTEFSAVRLQYQRQWLPDGHVVDSVTSQLNFTIGAHPAHSY